ncbi:hypothetical protein LTR78_005876 [Recurvomyces mirabilis]|uniref:FAD/NAD(P)-binding domain-containing protein n=1 Tax=Recurvomyces mirabilis TaxID=574656 RepID=A0AAE0WMH4_9PEZI|nr:hypothetical protein LTR78_005876 [Recurvomyces mirabilis]KAK5154257.1 hypothetical protein LTS14_006942 [Recurvomyces mirabilis]
MATVSDTSNLNTEYEAVVVGAGPAGVTCVGNLLERKVAPILWVDHDFNGGRVNSKYREVPSNTKAALFIDFATAVAPFRKIVSGTPSRSRWEEPSGSDGVSTDDKPDKLQSLRQLDPQKGCELSYAADMIMMLTEGLKKTPGVTAVRGNVSDAQLFGLTEQWNVNVQGHKKSADPAEAFSATTERLILCTGSSPTDTPLPGNTKDIPHFDLDDALSPSKMSARLSGLGPTTISVIGASHSAILVLRNLYNLASSIKPDLKIRWLTRHELRYAEFMNGWILRDNTGLKGEVAVWAKEHLEPENFKKSDVSKYIDAITYEKGKDEATFEKHLPGSDFVVQAIGYQRNATPTLTTTDGKSITPYYNHKTGGFEYDSGSKTDRTKLPGMYGAGIAWPERVTDPHGNVEYAVGFFKFMKYIKRVSPEWN